MCDMDMKISLNDVTVMQPDIDQILKFLCWEYGKFP